MAKIMSLHSTHENKDLAPAEMTKNGLRQTGFFDLPPYRKTGAATPLSALFSVVSQTIAATPLLLSVEVAYRNPKTGLTRGRIAEEACP